MIIGCHNEADIYGNHWTGGIAGNIKDNLEGVYIINCENSGSIEGNGYLGGIVGHDNNDGNIEGCINTGSVTGGSRAGGIIGSDSNPGAVIKNCYNTGEITSSSEGSANYAGGIVGCAGQIYIEQCWNSGNVTCGVGRLNYRAGGIAGEASGTIKCCYNSGEIYNANTVGGIVGYLRSNSYDPGRGNKVFDCFNTGLILGSGGSSRAGGIIGTMNTSKISTCYNTGIISATDAMGGIIGDIILDDSTVENCYYIDNISQGVGDGTDTTDSATCEQMKQSSMFVGFDFDSVWTMDGNATYFFPEIQNVLMDRSFVTSMIVTSESDTMPENKTMQMNVSSIVPVSADNKSFSWSVVNGSGEADIDDNGLLTATREGIVTVKVTANDGSGVTDTKDITIIYVAVTGVSINGNTGEIFYVGDTKSLSANVLPAGASYPEVSWSSDNQNVVTVDQNGKLTAIGVGEATITATADGTSDTCIITVEPIPVSSVKLSSEAETMFVDDTVTLTAEVLPGDATYPEVTWSSSNTDVATVNQSGFVTAVGLGDATITATADGVSDTCSIIVEELGFMDEIINGKLYRTYYNNDDSIEKVVIYYSVDDSSVIYKINYYEDSVRTSYEEYNESGALAKRVYLYSDGKQKRRELYNTDTGVWYSISEYYFNGQLSKKKYMHSNGKLRLCEFYSSSTGNKYAFSEYDINGKIEKKTYLYSSGVRKKIEYYSTSTGNKYAISEYRTNGKIEKKTYLYSSGVRKKIEYYSSTTGNKYAVSEYRTNGKIEKKTYLYSSGVRKKIYYYSSTTGNRFAVSEYRTNGTIAKKTYLYSSGVRKMIHYYSSTTGNKFATSYYDTNGDITHKEYFNSDGSVRETIYY